MITRTFIWLWLCMVLLTTAGNAQHIPDIQFTHITTANGLSTQYVRNIFQDSRGLVWVCTTNGLNRYDGNTFKVYNHIPGNANSFPNDDIWSIGEDKKGNFWVGTQNGLSYFEPGQNRFTNYIKEPGNKNSLASARAENVVVDNNGYVWVGGLNGLQQFDPVSKTFKTIEFASKDELTKNATAQSVYQLYLDRKDQLWVCAGGRVFLVNRTDLSFRKIIQNKNNVNGVNAIYQDTDGLYWLSFWGLGFAKFDGKHYPGDEDFVIKTGIYFRMAEWNDVHHNRWLVATKDDGISFYNKTTGKLVSFKHDNDIPNSFASHGGKGIMADKNNNCWIVTLSGIDVVEPGKQFFQYHWLGEKKDRDDNYEYGTPEPIYKDGAFYWAALWHGKGLVKLDSNWKTIKHYPVIPAGSSNLNDRTVFAIHKDQENIFWYSTERGLVRFDEKRNSFQLFMPTDILPFAFEFGKIQPYGSYRLFIRTRHLGLYVFNKQTKAFGQHFTSSGENALPADDVRDIVYDKTGILWIATSAGICGLDTSSLNIVWPAHGTTKNQTSFSSTNCWAIDADNSNNLWIGTDDGLYKLDPERKSFIKYTTLNGLCSNYIGQLVCDKNDNVWMNTSNGVSLFLAKENKFRNFYTDDGLPQNSMDGVINKDENGMIYFGDPGVVLTINPDELLFNQRKPDVIITDALLGGQHYTINKNESHEKYLATKFGNSTFSVNFAVLNYNSPNLNKYYYKLDGVDKEWHTSDRGIASYISIAPGKYTLRVKGSNNSGVMNEEGDFIHINIDPAWYQTSWFKGLVLLGIALIVFGFYRARIRSVRKKAYFKQKMAETEMQALRAQMNPHFIFNSLNSIENFIMRNEKRLASDYLNKFSSLIRSILDSSRNELVPVARDMEALQLYIDLEQLRFNNKFSYKTEVDAQLLGGDQRVPSLLIQPYVENAIVHGLAHSEKQELYVNVRAILENEYISYIVEDNGIGREKAANYNLQNKPYHKSVGMKITEDRIHIFNERQGGQGEIVITDLYDNDHRPAGTRVEIKIKAA